MGFSALDETMPAVRKCEENLTGQNRSAAVTVGGGAEKTENSSSSLAILFLVRTTASSQSEFTKRSTLAFKATHRWNER